MSTVRRLVLGGTAALALAVAFAESPVWAQRPALAQGGSPGAARAVPPTLANEQRELYQKAFAAADNGRWDEVRRLAAQGKDALANKVLRWLELQQPRNSASFEDLAAFIDANPDWPAQDILARRAEEALIDRTDDSVVMAWFALRGPVTADGAMRYAEALFRSGDRNKAVALVREAWSWGGFGDRQEAAYLQRYKQYLGKDDHVRRLDRLIWDGRHGEARRVMKLVDPGSRALAEARIRLASMSGGIDGVLKRVPDHLQNDPGLVFERIRWRRRKGQIDGAAELMRNAPPQLGRPELWWPEREFLARRAVANGRMSDAYRLVRNHHIAPGHSAYVDAEFMAGFIALRYLHDNSAALGHFTRLHAAARFPVTKARGAYWAGRAAEAAGDRKAAQGWYQKGAQFTTAYYGQLAHSKLDTGARPPWPTTPEATPAERRAFEQSELTRAARLMQELGQQERIKPFLLRHIAIAKSPAQHAMTAELAHALGRPDLAVSTVKRSSQAAGVLLPQLGWPTLPSLTGESPERALVHATIRQESAFEAQAVSRAGARGMMQLMPATARAVAKSMGMGAAHSDQRLFDPPYNISIGRAYLAGLVDDYGGSYVLALAAYNAGPGRVKQWLRDHGDPRRKDVDPIDWVERIPFDETRNYVQRVLENLQVYRHLLGSGQLAQGLPQDLRRGGN